MKAGNVKLQTKTEEQFPVAPPVKDRVKGTKYIYKGEIRIWNRNVWLCEHGKRKNYCIMCGGSSICKHGKHKRACKECGGSSFCEHGRQKHACKECGGSQICEHGRQKHGCKECGGSQICKHRRHKHGCKECGGSSFCEHGRQKHACKECGGSAKHGRVKYSCKKCGGSAICEHGKQRAECKDCGGSAICEPKRVVRNVAVLAARIVQSPARLWWFRIANMEKTDTSVNMGNIKFIKLVEVPNYVKVLGARVMGIKNLFIFCCVNLFPDIEVARNYKTVVSRVKFISRIFVDL